MKNLQIAILGGGIAGFTTAIALRKQGFDAIEVFERNLELSVQGAGLVLWPNAMCILEKLGLGAQIEKRSGSLKKMLRFSNKGESLGGISVTDLERHMGFESRPITRQNLYEILKEAVLALGIPIHYGKNAILIQENGTGKPQISFEDGSSKVSDIVIGADGRMKSAAREYVHGDNEPVYQHYVNWVGLIENEGLQINKTQSVHDYWGVGERFGYVPVNETTAYWAGCKKLPLGMAEPENGNKAFLLALFGEWPSPISEVIKRTPERHIRRIEVFDHDPISKWYRSNVCLVGDAAHAALPTSGQGACQAIEDAWHLAACMCREDQFLSAFEAFQKIRMEKTNGITQGARSFAQSLFNEDETFCITRNKNAQKANPNSQVLGMAALWSKFLPKN